MGLKVLVADDDDDARTVLCEMLTLKGLNPVCVNRGLAALLQYHKALNEGEPFDVLVLDVAMPDIGGFVVGEIVRELEKFPSHVPRARHVYFSAHPELINADRLKTVQADAYVQKPDVAGEIVNAVFGTLPSRAC